MRRKNDYRRQTGRAKVEDVTNHFEALSQHSASSAYLPPRHWLGMTFGLSYAFEIIPYIHVMLSPFYLPIQKIYGTQPELLKSCFLNHCMDTGNDPVYKELLFPFMLWAWIQLKEKFLYFGTTMSRNWSWTRLNRITVLCKPNALLTRCIGKFAD